MHRLFILILSMALISGCADKNKPKNNVLKSGAENNKPNLYHDSHPVNNNSIFSQTKKSRFETEAHEEKQKFNRLFKMGFEKQTPSSYSQYANNENHLSKTNRKIVFTMPVPEPVWNEEKQEVEFKWANKPKYTFDAF